MEKDKELRLEDLTEQERMWYDRRVVFFTNARVAVPDKLLLTILKEGREKASLINK